MYFIARRKLNVRILLTVSLALGFFGLIWVINNYKDTFLNFRTYYIRSYIYSAGYMINRAVLNPFTNSAPPPVQTGYAKSVPVLLYHGLLDNKPGSEASNVNLSTFWDQMKTLKAAGWQTVTMQDFYDFKRGRKQLPAKSFLLTFDDGRKDSYYPAEPLLKVLNYHAVMFAIDKYSLEEKSDYYLSEQELAKMAQSPQWEIQSHGYSSHSIYPVDSKGDLGHFFSNKLWLPSLNRNETTDEFAIRTAKDLQLAKIGLEKAFGRPIIAFAYPFGDYGSGTVDFPAAEQVIVPEALDIYPLVFYQYSNIQRYSQNYSTPGPVDGYMIRRIGISPSWSGQDVLNIFKAGEAKPLPFTAKLDKTDGWVNTDWGTMVLANGKLIIGALPHGTGSTVVLDGSRDWMDYTITAKAKWLLGSNIYLAARYQDDNNLVACNFSHGLAHIEQILNGETRVVAGTPFNFNPGSDQFTISITVRGRDVSCAINGNTIVSTPYLDPSLLSGGVGIKVWDSTPGNSGLEIDSFEVMPN